jgi:hypothetical protein
MLEYPKAATTDTKLIFKLSYTYKGKVYKKRYAVIIWYVERSVLICVGLPLAQYKLLHKPYSQSKSLQH